MRRMACGVAVIITVGCAPGATTGTEIVGASPTGAESEEDMTSTSARPIPTWDGPGGEDAAMVGTLRGSAIADGGCLWLEISGGRELAVVWPQGYSARFNPVELIGPDGSVVAEQGARLALGGGGQPGQLERCGLGLETHYRVAIGGVSLAADT